MTDRIFLYPEEGGPTAVEVARRQWPGKRTCPKWPRNEAGLTKNLDAAMRSQRHSLEFLPLSEEMKRRSFEAAVNTAIPWWVERLDGAGYTIISDTFNNKLGPIAGLGITPDGTVVRTNQRDGRRQDVRGRNPNSKTTLRSTGRRRRERPAR